ncbi:hypothetical protein B0H11DRAFT_2342850 [Mycena galericulata]|nr:hypothetical protein B0H11DRAFT_2342850 [Mycena galericulata]
MVRCPGCQIDFSLSGYTLHLQRTGNEACWAVHDENMHYRPDLEPEEEQQPVQFGGDYFGTYQEEDFDMDQEREPADPRRDGEDDFDNLPDLMKSDDSDSEDEDGDLGWEPPVLDGHQFPGIEDEPDEQRQADGPDAPRVADAQPNVPARENRASGEEQVRQQPIIVQFTDGDAGAPLRRGEAGYERYKAGSGDPTNIWAPFTSKLEWELARWAKLRGPGSTAFIDLLKISGVTERLGLSYKNSRELNNIIDTSLPGRPKFKRKEIVVGGEAYDVYFRDILECVKALFGDPEFAAHLKVSPERHYADEDQTVRLYHDMHTGKWWWATQVSLRSMPDALLLTMLVKRELEKKKKGATVIPIIISSDKTLLTLFRNRTAYPVYLSIGNIPKDIRRKPSRQAQILLAYLPTSKLEHITVKASRRRILANLFHACMSKIVEPLKTAGVDGMVVCEESAKELGATPVDGEPDKFRDLEAILDVLATFDDNPAEFVEVQGGRNQADRSSILIGKACPTSTKASCRETLAAQKRRCHPRPCHARVASARAVSGAGAASRREILASQTHESLRDAIPDIELRKDAGEPLGSIGSTGGGRA